MNSSRTTQFQSFEDLSQPDVGAPRIAALRQELDRRNMQGWLVPHGDAHQSEYPPESEQRLRWLTGFSGSAGFAIVLKDKAVVFVDGRYTLQVQSQVDTTVFEICHLIDEPPSKWLESRNLSGAKIGYDPMLMTGSQVKTFEKAATKAGASLEAVLENPIDEIWTDQPTPPSATVELHPVEFNGKPAAEKITSLQEAIKAAGAEASIFTAAESAAWLFNVRGRDVTHVPVALANIIAPVNAPPRLYIDPAKLTNEVASALAAFCDVRAPGAFLADLADFGGKPVQLSPASVPAAVVSALKEVDADIIEGNDLIALPRAIKNEAEINGTRAAHARDAVAVCHFLHWLEEMAGATTIDEIDCVEALERFRRETGALEDISFDTISGAGPNSAVIHYRVSEASNRPLENDTLYLVDSGAQYRDGTTDITRTIAVGTPTPEMVRNFTLVLKGMIAVSTIRFPKGTTGAQIDGLARAALWNAGLNFDHGTGHGVGSFLGVHEGPQRIAKTGNIPLEPGMILSNEPGYYRDGHYGIRIENLILVEPPAPIEGGDRDMMGFETLTFAPIDRRLIDVTLLTPSERAWLNDYHRQVRDLVSPSLDDANRQWLEAATAPLAPLA
ncbi:MAG: aminopeptidase P family protein [Pseudomonadota bacterium]